MRGKRAGRTLFSSLLLFSLGCWTTDSQIKPPTFPEELVVPPENDTRFSSPMTYPKEAQRDNPLKKANTSNTDGIGPTGNMPRFGAGSRGY